MYCNMLLVDETGRKHSVKCLMDAGWESNFLFRKLSELLQLKQEKINILVSELNALQPLQ